MKNVNLLTDFTQTAWVSFKRFLRGKTVLVTPDEEYRRMEQCLDCVYLNGDSEKNYHCSLCKCYLRFKVQTAASECPVGKWPRIDP